MTVTSSYNLRMHGDSELIIDGRVMWRAERCADYIGVKRATWIAYNARRTKEWPAPRPTYVGRTPLWDAEEVKQWHAGRPGSPIAQQ